MRALFAVFQCKSSCGGSPNRGVLCEDEMTSLLRILILVVVVVVVVLWLFKIVLRGGGCVACA